MGKIEWTGRGDWNPQGLNRSQRAMIGARLIGAGVTHGGDRRSRAWNTAGPRRRSCRELAVAALRMPGSSCRAAPSRSSPPWNEANLPSHRWRARPLRTPRRRPGGEWLTIKHRLGDRDREFREQQQ
jgi:hypothetical protein